MSHILELAKKADADTLMMSCKHCHAKNVSSIVLKHENGSRLTRMFLAWPGHNLSSNVLGGDLAVGIHDHRYDIWLTLLHGNVRNRTYWVMTDKGDQPHDLGKLLNEWLFESGGTDAPPKVTANGKKNIEWVTEEWLDSKWLFLNATTLHNIDVCGTAAWLVQEGDISRRTTRLYTKADSVVTEGLYEKFSSPNEVISHVEEFCRAFLRCQHCTLRKTTC